MSKAPLIDRAVAHARREAYRAASGMTTAALRAGVDDYYAACGAPPRHSEAEAQERMVRAVIAHRARSTRSALARRAGRP